MDLFSRVDYSYTNLKFLKNLIWMIGGIWIFWLLRRFFWGISRQNLLAVLGLNWHVEKSSSSVLWQVKGRYLILFGRFVVVLGCKLWGLVPYVFGITTQIVVTLTGGLIIWLRIFVSSFFYSPVSFFAHLTPLGAPVALISPLNLIELVSQLIRPFTLSLRLGIKMTTGHIFIGLLGVRGMVLTFNSYLILSAVFFLLWGYFLFEIGICIIQAFVFRLLRVQYLDEHV